MAHLIGVIIQSLWLQPIFQAKVLSRHESTFPSSWNWIPHAWLSTQGGPWPAEEIWSCFAAGILMRKKQEWNLWISHSNSATMDSLMTCDWGLLGRLKWYLKMWAYCFAYCFTSDWPKRTLRFGSPAFCFVLVAPLEQWTGCSQGAALSYSKRIRSSAACCQMSILCDGQHRVWQRDTYLDV